MQEVNENHSRRAYFCTTAIQHREWNGNYNYFIFCIATLPMLHSAKKNGLKKQRNKLYLCHKVICESYEITERWHLKISIVSHETKESVQKPFFFKFFDIYVHIVSKILLYKSGARYIWKCIRNLTLHLLNYVQYHYYPHFSLIFIVYKGKQ